MPAQFTEAVEAGFQVGVMLFAPIWGVRVLLSLLADRLDRHE